MTVHVQAKGPRPGRAHGVVFIHSCPRAMCAHVEWALARVFGTSVSLDWSEQPVAPGTVRAEILWTASEGTGARIASVLLGFPQVRSEVTEDATDARMGERFAMTPTLGLFRADIGVHGDVMVPEGRLRSALTQASSVEGEVAEEIARLIGTPWDAELEPFRCAHEGSTVRVLHHVV